MLFRSRSLLLIKLSVAPESTRTCLSVIECKDFKRVGICSDLYLLVKTIFDSNLRKRAQTDGVAISKNPLQDQPTFQSQLPSTANNIFFVFSRKGLTIANPGVCVTNQGIGLQQTNTKSPCYKGNKRRMHPFGFPTSLGPDRPRETHVVTL